MAQPHQLAIPHDLSRLTTSGTPLVQRPIPTTSELVLAPSLDTDTLHVKVKDGRCLARHYAGVGLGRPSFADRLRYRPCDGYLPADVFQSVRDDLAKGWKVTDLTTHDRYGFPSHASIDNDGTIEDQGWGFEIGNFRLRP